MSHKLIALIVKAQNEQEAEQKAEHILDNVICGGPPNDFGIVLNSKRDLEREDPDTYRWIPQDKTNPHYEELSRTLITAPVVSESGQKFIKSSYPPTTEPQNEIEKLTVAMASTGYYVRDETGQYMQQDDSRLNDKDYFVVPVDVHS